MYLPLIQIKQLNITQEQLGNVKLTLEQLSNINLSQEQINQLNLSQEQLNNMSLSDEQLNIVEKTNIITYPTFNKGTENNFPSEKTYFLMKMNLNPKMTEEENIGLFKIFKFSSSEKELIDFSKNILKNHNSIDRLFIGGCGNYYPITDNKKNALKNINFDDADKSFTHKKKKIKHIEMEKLQQKKKDLEQGKQEVNNSQDFYINMLNGYRMTEENRKLQIQQLNLTNENLDTLLKIIKFLDEKYPNYKNEWYHRLNKKYKEVGIVPFIPDDEWTSILDTKLSKIELTEINIKKVFENYSVPEDMEFLFQ